MKSNLQGEAWEEGFSTGLLRSLVAVPFVSRGVLAPLAALTGTEDDRRDNVGLELLLMQVSQYLIIKNLTQQVIFSSSNKKYNSNKRIFFPLSTISSHHLRMMQALADVAAAPGAASGMGPTARPATLEAIYPIFVGDPCTRNFVDLGSDGALNGGGLGSTATGCSGYPSSGNFFHDCAALVASLPDVVSPPTARAAAEFLEAHGVNGADRALTRTVRASVQGILTRQGAELWASPAAAPEILAPDSEVLVRAMADPPAPALDAAQLGMVRAQLRGLVPSIHEVFSCYNLTDTLHKTTQTHTSNCIDMITQAHVFSIIWKSNIHKPSLSSICPLSMLVLHTYVCNKCVHSRSGFSQYQIRCSKNIDHLHEK